MLWNEEITYLPEPFDLESELEDAVKYLQRKLFGAGRFYLDVKKRIKRGDGRSNIPDGYLLDLTSIREPKLYVVENELARHEPLKHVAVQILSFSLALETSPRQVAHVVKEALRDDEVAFERCNSFAVENGFENVDVLLDRIVHGDHAFNALVIIDEVSDDLERALRSRFQFPVEIVTLRRFATERGNRIYEFEPFLSDLVSDGTAAGASTKPKALDRSQIDTIVVPARDEGFKEVFIDEDRWYKIRIHSEMIPRLRYIAVYRVAPTSAITHVAEIDSIEQWPNSNKYVVNFKDGARKIGPIKLVPKGSVKAPQAPRYTQFECLKVAKNLDEAFG